MMISNKLLFSTLYALRDQGIHVDSSLLRIMDPHTAPAGPGGSYTRRKLVRPGVPSQISEIVWPELYQPPAGGGAPLGLHKDARWGVAVY